MSWTSEWVDACSAAEKRAASQTCDRCGTQKVIGYSNLGIPLTACPSCSPSLVANGKRSVGDVWGYWESA